MAGQLTLWNVETGKTYKVRNTPEMRRRLAQCGSCGRVWDNEKVTSVTPAPGARCPFEYQHKYDKHDNPSQGDINRYHRARSWMFN